MIHRSRYVGFVVIATTALSTVSRARIAVGTGQQDDAARNSSRTSLPDSERLNARKKQLIQDAGEEPLNYLRSMFEPGFFARNPQEFFASLSNQWFTDSEKTILLGLRRFDSGRRHPINQALFFADVYSRGTENTVFFQTDTKANIRHRMVPLHRDGKGRIQRILLGGGWHRFELDENGRVVSYRVDKSHP
jgi:hypothetical protein